MEEIIKDQRIAMVAVIKDSNGKILIIREATDDYEDGYSAGKWTMPGGRLEIGERWEDGLRREILEEIGLSNLQLLQPIYIGEWTPIIKTVRTQIVGIFYLCLYSGEEVKLSNEHDSYEWVESDDIDKYDYAGPQKEVLKRVFEIREE